VKAHQFVVEVPCACVVVQVLLVAVALCAFVAVLAQVVVMVECCIYKVVTVPAKQPEMRCSGLPQDFLVVMYTSLLV
jgi:hypothetical protein